MNLRNRLKYGAFIVFGLLIIGYSAFTARNSIRGPMLDVDEPEISTSTVVIKGHAYYSKFISLNDQAITVDELGNFSEIRLLEPGYNVYKLFIRDRFNRTNQKILRFYRP